MLAKYEFTIKLYCLFQLHKMTHNILPILVICILIDTYHAHKLVGPGHLLFSLETVMTDTEQKPSQNKTFIFRNHSMTKRKRIFKKQISQLISHFFSS